MTSVFNEGARSKFAANYPEQPHLLRHELRDHPLLTLAALAKAGERLPPSSVEYNLSDLPIGVDADAVEANGLTIGETILRVHEARSWAVLKNLEQLPEYERLLLDLLKELRPVIEARTGRMLRPQAFAFISSPNSMTPYHFDPEHNILLQLEGTKVMTQFPAGDERFAPATSHEAYHSGSHRNLVWDDSYLHHGMPFELAPGDAIFVPVMAPHFVRSGPKPAISLSITWRSEWSFAEADAHGFNRVLRKIGIRPVPPGRFPNRNIAKATAFRAMRKVGLDRLAK